MNVGSGWNAKNCKKIVNVGYSLLTLIQAAEKSRYDVAVVVVVVAVSRLLLS